MTSTTSFDCDSSFDFDDSVDLVLADKQPEELDFLDMVEYSRDTDRRVGGKSDGERPGGQVIEHHDKNKKTTERYKDIPRNTIESAKRVLFA